jgi:hypothetical protein
LRERCGSHCRSDGWEDESWKNGFPIEVGMDWPKEWIGQEKLSLFYWQVAAHLNQILREFLGCGSTTGSFRIGAAILSAKTGDGNI